MKKSIIILGAVAAAFALVVIVFFSSLSSSQKEGNHMEQELSAQYQAAQLELDTYVKKIKESVGIANLKSDKLDQVISDAVKGRYENNSSAQPGRGQLFSAIKEAYPDASGLNIYDRLIDQVNAGREAYKQTQLNLRDKLRAYDTWRTDGLLRPHILSGCLGFPTQNLEARIGTSVKHGRDAEDQMKLLVTSSETDQAYQTGHDEPIDFTTPKK
jgi:hypothetical protein